MAVDGHGTFQVCGHRSGRRDMQTELEFRGLQEMGFQVVEQGGRLIMRHPGNGFVGLGAAGCPHCGKGNAAREERKQPHECYSTVCMTPLLNSALLGS